MTAIKPISSSIIAITTKAPSQSRQRNNAYGEEEE